MVPRMAQARGQRSAVQNLPPTTPPVAASLLVSEPSACAIRSVCQEVARCCPLPFFCAHASSICSHATAPLVVTIVQNVTREAEAS